MGREHSAPWELYPKDKVVILSPDAETVLHDLDTEKVSTIRWNIHQRSLMDSFFLVIAILFTRSGLCYLWYSRPYGQERLVSYPSKGFGYIKPA